MGRGHGRYLHALPYIAAPFDANLPHGALVSNGGPRDWRVRVSQPEAGTPTRARRAIRDEGGLAVICFLLRGVRARWIRASGQSVRHDGVLTGECGSTSTIINSRGGCWRQARPRRGSRRGWRRMWRWDWGGAGTRAVGIGPGTRCSRWFREGRQRDG